MISYCVYKFLLDDDMTSIVFRQFNGKGDEIYPSLSLCFKGKGVFDTVKIQKLFNSNLDYQKFLNGRAWDKRMLDVNYDNVSLDAQKLFEHVKLQASNGYTFVPIYTWKKETKKSERKLEVMKLYYCTFRIKDKYIS